MLGNKQIMGENIQRYLDEKGMTRKELAEALGFPYSSVTDWINGKMYPRIDKIEMMANFFGIQKSDLVEQRVGEISTEGTMTFGQRVRARREELGLTQEELATRLGYKSKSSINKIETGINNLPMSKVARFARALEIDPDLLMGWGDEPEESPQYDLTDREKRVLELFSGLNGEGQRRFIEYVTDLLRIREYRIEDDEE